jgi:NAD+ diphosphatase
MSEQVDRAAEERADPGLLDRTRADASTRVIVCAGDTAPLLEPGRLLLVPAHQVPAGAEWAFLGRDAHGSALLSASFAAADEPFDAPGGWGSLRIMGGDLPPVEGELVVEAMSLGRWLIDAPFCPACGTRTQIANAGWSRSCPSCGREHFPRTDPAAIVAVRSAHGDRLLLGSNALWGADRYSCFAGFVEAGESLEAAARREVREEAGVDLTTLDYRGSQPWPYPRSLMVGFLATAADDEAARADGEEILEVRWFERDEIGEALAGHSSVLLPGPSSIAHRLISDWHAGCA